MNIDNIPKLWRDKLADIQQFAPSALIMGGALRDLDNGRPIKDVDIFVSYGTNWDAIDRLLGGPTKQQFFEYGQQTEVNHAAAYDVDGVEFNIIALGAGYVPVERLPLLDFGICQIAFDGANVHTTPSYWNDKANRRFTLRRCDSVKAATRSHRRWVRLSEKYPNWELLVPDPFLPYWQEATSLGAR